MRCEDETSRHFYNLSHHAPSLSLRQARCSSSWQPSPSSPWRRRRARNSRAAILQRAKLLRERYQKQHQQSYGEGGEQRYRVPQFEEAIDGVTLGSPKGEQLIVRLRSVDEAARAKAARATIDGEWARLLTPPIERAALEYIDFIGELREAMSEEYVPILQEEGALLAAASARFGPQPLLRRVRDLAEAAPRPAAKEEEEDDDEDEEDDEEEEVDILAEEVFREEVIEEILTTSAAAAAAAAKPAPPPPLTRSDIPAVWTIFANSVRMLLMHQAALSSRNGSSKGWRSSVEWRLLRTMHEDARREGKRNAAALIGGGLPQQMKGCCADEPWADEAACTDGQGGSYGHGRHSFEGRLKK